MAELPAKVEAEVGAALAGIVNKEERDLRNLEQKDDLMEAFHLSDDDGMDARDEVGEVDDDQELAELAALVSGDVPKAPSALMQALVNVCKVCGKHPAMKNQVLCSSSCGGDVRGATRQAKEQGPEAWKAFQALRKTNPDEFVAAIHIV